MHFRGRGAAEARAITARGRSAGVSEKARLAPPQCRPALFSWDNIVRSLRIGFLFAVGCGWQAAADTGITPAESQRWGAPAETVSISDDRDVPYIAYFTPPYRDAGTRDIAWSMMATRWRESGEIQLSVGLRIVHDGAEPWRIVGWRIADSSFPPRIRTVAAFPAATVAALKPLKSCSDGLCRTYEAASFALPVAALEQPALPPAGALEITILTQAGELPSIRFPAAILADLRRRLGTH